MSEQVQIQLDRRHKVLHDPPKRWTIHALQPDGKYDMIAFWDGGRRSVLAWCADHGVVPMADAEAALNRIPETGGFKDR